MRCASSSPSSPARTRATWWPCTPSTCAMTAVEALGLPGRLVVTDRATRGRAGDVSRRVVVPALVTVLVVATAACSRKSTNVVPPDARRAGARRPTSWASTAPCRARACSCETAATSSCWRARVRSTAVRARDGSFTVQGGSCGPAARPLHRARHREARAQQGATRVHRRRRHVRRPPRAARRPAVGLHRELTATSVDEIVRHPPRFRRVREHRPASSRP